MMEVFFLEEEDSNEMFLTQVSQEDKNCDDNRSIFGDGMDFQSPCVSLRRDANFNLMSSQYDDISDEDFEIPSSQEIVTNDRYVDV